MTRSGLRFVAVPAVLLLMLSACSTQESIEPDPSAVALLDQSTGQIHTPLSGYDLTDSAEDTAVLNHAVSIWIADCMRKAGFPYAATVPETEVLDDRSFGIWFEPNIRVHGWGFPPNPNDQLYEQDALAGGEEWLEAESTCADQLRESPELGEVQPTQQEETDSLIPNLRTEAYRQASGDPEWEVARDEWRECLREAGLEPLTGPQDWFSAQSKELLEQSSVPPTAEQLQQQIVLASTEARCNNETRLTQRLANLVASYEAPLIAENQAALNELKQRKQERLNRARDYIAQNG